MTKCLARLIVLLAPVIHNKHEYAKGDNLLIGEDADITDALAARLVALGVAEWVPCAEDDGGYDDNASAKHSDNDEGHDEDEIKTGLGDEGTAPEDEKPEFWTKDRIQSELTAQGVLFKSADNKATLLALLAAQSK
ncbi:hypothetical protein I2492_09410 [Budviciaceae bacterium CWB-B4]|uniref:Uncharacterized protein n=1 Tax=Limnobaculum xujianqingii TaxID=2738837 RepID=A0A9D7FXY5_9GAMM|nr:hypothetical protein [Limnobaculum xujianqingii]MBK5073232.1 hypothetical protein [Limnobaculum xujianqingii]MBK5176541.1 hypothetical protein [Limnobaculum xujianqingii]